MRDQLTDVNPHARQPMHAQLSVDLPGVCELGRGPLKFPDPRLRAWMAGRRSMFDVRKALRVLKHKHCIIRMLKKKKKMVSIIFPAV